MGRYAVFGLEDGISPAGHFLPAVNAVRTPDLDYIK